MDSPLTHYALTSDGVHIAFQTVGDGPKDLVCALGMMSNIDAVWELPEAAAFYRKLSGFTRLILFDRRGSGVSDKPGGDRTPPLEVGVEDVLAVLNAVGSRRAALLGIYDGGQVSCLFAATHPDRTDALLLHVPETRGLLAEDYQWANPAEEWQTFIAQTEASWGTLEFTEPYLSWLAPTLARGGTALATWARYFRLCGSPASIAALQRMFRDSDIRHVLPSIQAPTLITHREDDLYAPVEMSRYVADQIPGAKIAVLPGRDYMPFRDEDDALTGEIERFLTGARHVPDADRVLATVLFTDIVGSTQRLAEVGDARWRSVLSEHDARARSEIESHRGRFVNSTGDGLLATFDGPARAIRCASAIVDSVRTLGLEIRAGLHTGEVELLSDDVRGIAVHIGARVMSLAGPSDVLVSQTVKDLVAGSGLVFEDAGEHELKGVPDRWHLYRVVG